MDIVQRLAEDAEAWDIHEMPEAAQNCRDAIAEIERLRAAAGGDQVREAKRLRQPEPPVSSTVRNGRMGF